MLKILHLITDLETGGAEMMLLKLVQGMNKSEFQNVVVSMMDGGTLGPELEKTGVPVYCLSMKRGGISPVYVLRLLRIIRQEKPDIIQTWLYHADLLGTITARILKVPVIWNLRCADMDLRKYSRLTSFVVRLCTCLSSYPQAIIVNSEAGKEVHGLMGYRPRQWARIPNGFDISRFRPDETSGIRIKNELNIPNGSIVIGIVARDDPMKDLNNFIETANVLLCRLKDKHQVCFLMVGRGISDGNERLKRAITEGNMPYFRLLGERNDVPELMCAMDIYCSSSVSEGFPNVIGEAMASGVPCVVTDAGDSAIIVGDTGRVVPVKTPEALADACLELINMPVQERLELGKRARERIERNFNLPVVISRYEDLYMEIVNNVRN
jgi:glycosyltransferase involved in cell wall biosynthesis